MKITKRILLTLLVLSLLTPPYRTSEEEEEDEDEESPEEWIDTGCVKERPAMCPDGMCHENYDECEILPGCTDAETPIMCPSGMCVSNFDECVMTSYNCVIHGYERCPDGFCRINCSGIRTNGCYMDAPYFCPNGTCTKYLIECTDYRCPDFNEPFVCDDLSCKKSTLSCPINQTSYMIEDTVDSKVLNLNEFTHTIHTVWNSKDSNMLAIKMYFTGNSLFYNEFTAAFRKLTDKSIEEITGDLHFEPVPASVYDGSTIDYPEIDLEIEKLTSIIFSKEFKMLQSSEFIRSTVFKFSLDDFDYNHFLFNSFPSVQMRFNKIANFPRSNLSETENEELKKKYDTEYDLSDGSKFYCLAIFDEEHNEWHCAARKIYFISDKIIEYKLPRPGVYAVIYSPESSTNNIEYCGFICQNKKAVFGSILLIIPVAFLVFMFVKDILMAVYERTKKKLKGLTAEDNDPFYEELHQEEEKGEKIDLDKLIHEDYYEIKGNTHTFVNPLAYGQDSGGKENEETKLENQKIKLKFENSQALGEKLKLLKKLSALNSEIAEIKNEISKLKKLQGINAIYENFGERGDEGEGTKGNINDVSF